MTNLWKTEEYKIREEFYDQVKHSTRKRVVCPICGYEVSNDWYTSEDNKERWNYCPHCGNHNIKEE